MHLTHTARGRGLAASLLVLPALLAVSDYSARAGSTERAPAGRTAPSLQQMLGEAGKWLVAIEIVRETGSDIRPSRRARRRGREARAYFQRPEGLVSGVLLGSGGHVLTTRYNVAGKIESVKVTLYNGSSYKADLLATSDPDDLALLRIVRDDGDPELPDHPVRWGGGKRLRAGQILFALGRSPDAGRITVTRGIISAVSRNGGRAVQTDAKLNYGNVGGPLVDLDGRVVAIACHVGHNQPQWGINSGVGFGTTAATVQAILPRLKSGKDVRWDKMPLLGVKWNDEAFETRGAEILLVVPDSGAAEAGLKAGDRILEIDGEPIASFAHLRRLIFLKMPQQKIRIKVQRGTEELEMEATLGVVE